MARTVSDIQTQIESSLVANFATIGITIDGTKWSKRNMLRMLCFTFAIVSAYVEQLMDALKLSLETTASQSASASPLWIQAQMFAFQYSSTNPQVLQLVDTVPIYPVIDPSLRIITACSVTSTAPNEVIIKVTKTVSGVFVKLDAPEIAAAQGYINTIGSAGINYSIISLDSDKIYVNANVYYQGQYASVISVNMIDSINSFLDNLSITNFNGALKISDLENIMRNVTGVNDIELLNVKIRDNATIFASGVDMVLNQQTKLRLWNSIAGYIGEETTSGKTFVDSLNFIAE